MHDGGPAGREEGSVRAIFAAAGLAAMLVAPPARAEFEGLVEGRVTGTMAGTFRAQVGKAGIRSEVEMGMPAAAKAGGAKGMPGMPASMKRFTVQRRAEPNKVFVLDEERKTYMVVDTAEVREGLKGAPTETFTVRKLGKDTVAGFACEKVVATGSQSGEAELCVTAEIAPEWARGAVEQGRGGGALLAALRQAGLPGFPVRWSRQDGEGGKITMELTSAKRQSIPASTFEIPAGYQESKGMPGPGMGGGDASKQLEDAMKRLTPEQRKQMEQMLKGQRQGSP